VSPRFWLEIKANITAQLFGLFMVLKENIPLAQFSTLEIGGPARFMVEASDESEVLEALEAALARNLPLLVLGGGSNMVFSDSGFPGLVLKIATRGLQPVDDAEGIVNVAAGEDWDRFVSWSVEHNLAGIECLSGIPGTVGGTPIQNVGAYGQEVSEVIASVRAVERETGCIMDLSKVNCGFAYRTSTFNTTQRDRFVVLSVSFWLRPGGEPRIQYADLRRFFEKQSDTVGLADIRNAVLKIRAGKAMLITPGDPDCRSVGSFFKNPLLSEERLMEVEESARIRGCLAKNESMLRYKSTRSQVKLAAAWLIERAGFHKGYGRGRVGLSSKHTLALVNRGGATAAEVLALMSEIQDGVRAAFGIDLVPEPVFVGFDNPSNKFSHAVL
jgi:UDP-N-acetylmuramate dehydrogenase